MLTIILRNRQIGSHTSSYTSSCYQCILPRQSVNSVDTHTEIVYKFTPDGTQLITFAPDWRTLSIYRYVGVTRDGTRHASADRIFDQAFRLQQHVTTPDPSILFCPHFCFLFSSDSRFLITADRQTAAAAAAAPSLPPPDTPHSLLTREAYLQAGVAPQQTPELLTEQCTVSRLLLISLSSGRVSDSLEVLLSTSHLRGVSAGLSVWLHGYSLAVLSPLSQTLHLLQISPARDGAGTARLVERYSPIGYFLSYPDYQLFLSHPSHASCPPPDQLYPPHMLSQLQQKVFVCLLRQQLAKRSSDRLLPLYSSWELLREMRVWRIQLLSEDTLLLRYKLTRTPNRTQFHLHNLWVIYCCATQRVAHACYDQLDDTREMLQLCEQQLPPLQDPVRYNPWYSSRSRLLETGGAVVTRDALRQLLDRYPVKQHRVASYSPYLDTRLFCVSDQLLPVVLTNRRGDFEDSIRFFNADSRQFSFCLHLCMGDWSPREVKLVPHPFDPFIISVEKYQGIIECNFHFR